MELAVYLPSESHNVYLFENVLSISYIDTSGSRTPNFWDDTLIWQDTETWEDFQPE
jgi:hypothetical protein